MEGPTLYISGLPFRYEAPTLCTYLQARGIFPTEINVRTCRRGTGNIAFLTMADQRSLNEARRKLDHTPAPGGAGGWLRVEEATRPFGRRGGNTEDRSRPRVRSGGDSRWGDNGQDDPWSPGRWGVHGQDDPWEESPPARPAGRRSRRDQFEHNLEGFKDWRTGWRGREGCVDYRGMRRQPPSQSRRFQDQEPRGYADSPRRAPSPRPRTEAPVQRRARSLSRPRAPPTPAARPPMMEEEEEEEEELDQGGLGQKTGTLYILCRYGDPEDLLLSQQHKLWALPPDLCRLVNGHMYKCDNQPNRPVYLIFAQADTRHVDGYARVMSGMGEAWNVAEWKSEREPSIRSACCKVEWVSWLPSNQQRPALCHFMATVPTSTVEEVMGDALLEAIKVAEENGGSLKAPRGTDKAGDLGPRSPPGFAEGAPRKAQAGRGNGPSQGVVQRERVEQWRGDRETGKKLEEGGGDDEDHQHVDEENGDGDGDGDGKQLGGGDDGDDGEDGGLVVRGRVGHGAVGPSYRENGREAVDDEDPRSKSDDDDIHIYAGRGWASRRLREVNPPARMSKIENESVEGEEGA